MVQKQIEHDSASPDDPTTPYDSGYVVGVDIGGTNLRLALADMTGTILAKWVTSTEGIRDPDVVVDLIRSGVDHVLQETSIPHSSLRALTAGVPGVTDVDAGVVIATSYLMGWRDVPLRMLLESTLYIPTAVDNDVNMAALGESWRGAARGTRDFVFLAIGTGIGAGIMLNNQLFRGMGWTAGEIGYMLVPGISEEPVERGQPGALEHVVGGQGIKAQWRSVWQENSTGLPEDMTATQIFDHALDGNRFAQTILQRAAQALAYGIYNLSLALNCPLFVLGGGVGMHPALSEATRNILKQRGARVQPRLELSTLGEDAQITGAIRLAIDTARSKTTIASQTRPYSSKR
jgi:glucokinase